jgi:hypothetical protein
VERADRLAGRDAGHRLERLANPGPVQPEVAAAAATLHGEEPAADEFREVPARGRRRHARLRGERACRQRAAVAERREHP